MHTSLFQKYVAQIGFMLIAYFVLDVRNLGGVLVDALFIGAGAALFYEGAKLYDRSMGGGPAYSLNPGVVFIGPPLLAVVMCAVFGLWFLTTHSAAGVFIALALVGFVIDREVRDLMKSETQKVDPYSTS